MTAYSDNTSVRHSYSEEQSLFLELVQNDVELRKMRFNGPITLFDELSSMRMIDLRGATFMRPFSISGKIEGRLLMNDTTFLGGFKAFETVIEGGISAVGTHFHRDTSFKHTCLKGGCDFTNAKFESPDRPFEGAEFYGMPTGLSWIQLAPAVVYHRRSC